MPRSDLSALTAELSSLRARIDEQQAELAELRTARPDPGVSRRHLLRNLAGLGAAGAAGMVATASPAAAADGDPLVLGQANTSTQNTTLAYSNGSGWTADVTLGDAFLAVGGTSSHGSGVWGYIEDQGLAGVRGQVDQSSGLGVLAEALQAGSIALGADSVSGPAMWAKSDDGVTLRLEPATRAGPPTTVPAGLAVYETGAFSVDNTGEVWLCTQGGTPGTWTRLLREDTAPGRVVPITPFRALDTRRPGGQGSGGPVIPGQVQGPLSSGQTVTLDLAGVAPIPAGASGVIGNATVRRPTSPGRLRVFPAGVVPSTSTLNFTVGTVANAFTSGLAASGLSAVATLPSGGSYHLVLDITAYIT